MKKIFLLLAIAIQFSIAQTNPIAGEYISQDTPTSGVNLILGNDNTYHIAIFSGKYTVKNDSIYFESGKDENYFNIKFDKGKPAKQIEVIIGQNNVYSFLFGIHLGIQEKENGQISYKSLSDYFDENELEEFTNNLYDNDNNEEDNKKLSFTLPRPYALYFVKDKNSAAYVEKYVIPSDVNTVSVDKSYNSLRELELSGTIDDDKTLTVVADGKNAIKFQHKSSVPKADFIQPISKLKIKDWTYDGKKGYNEFSADSTAVDSAAAYADYDYNEETDYKFAAKVEISFEEAIKNLKSKYLVIYYNPKSKNQQEEFDEIVKDYSESVSYDMYDEYNPDYDNFNFYLANSKDEKFLKANGIKKFPVTLVIDENKQVLATHVKKYTSNLGEEINRFGFLEDVKVAQNAKQIDELFFAKNSDNSKLIKLFADDTNNFFNEYLDIPHENYVSVHSGDEDYEYADTTAVAIDSYYDPSFDFYKIKMTKVAFTQKLKDLYNFFQAKKIIDEDFIGVLLNEISYNKNSRKFFKEDHSIVKEDIVKYLAYAINYNGNEANKIKVLNNVAGYIIGLDDITGVLYEDIAQKMLVSSNYKPFQIKAFLKLFATKKEFNNDMANAINNLYYTVNTNQALFDNLNKEFEDVNEIYNDRSSSWEEFKDYYAMIFASGSQIMIDHNETSKYNDAQKWLECANKISKNNSYVLGVMVDYYSKNGDEKKATAAKAKLEALEKKTVKE